MVILSSFVAYCQVIFVKTCCVDFDMEGSGFVIFDLSHVESLQSFWWLYNQHNHQQIKELTEYIDVALEHACGASYFHCFHSFPLNNLT